MKGLSRRPASAGPRALRPGYLAALAAVLVVLVGVLAVSELRAARRAIVEAMAQGSALLVQTIARAGEHAIRADAQLESLTAQRLLAQARLVRQLDRAAPLSDSLLTRLAAEAGVYRINVFDGSGARVHSSAPHDQGQEGPDASGEELADLLTGRADETVIGFRAGRFHGGQRFAAAVRRPSGGAIVVNVDAADMLAFRQRAGIGRLAQEIGAKADIAYLVLQDRAGVVLASRGVRGMGRIAGDAFLEAALVGEAPQSRLVEYEGRQVFETVLPFWVDADTPGLIRLALVADAMVLAEARTRRRLVVWAGLLAVVGVALVGWITVRQNLALLGEAHQRIQTYSSRLLEHMADAVVAVDGQGRVAVYNEAAAALFEVPVETAQGAHAGAVLGEGGRLVCRALAEERELSGDVCRCRTPSGRAVEVSVSLSLLRNGAGQVETAVAVIQDLTERRALEADLRRRERLSAMGELASGVAHEVRNPLNAIAVIAQRLQREFEPTLDGEEYAQLTGTVRQEVTRVDRIVRQFLELARPPALERADTDVGGLLAEAARLVESEAGQRGVQVDTRIDGAGRARVDGEQLKQAVLNLLTNAVDAAAEAGAPAGPSGEGGAVRLTARRAGGELQIAVTDNGRGIAPSERDRIFDLYYTTKPAGTGLGLGLAQRIAAEHGGRIAVDSELDSEPDSGAGPGVAAGTAAPGRRGSTFTIYLPLADDEAA